MNLLPNPLVPALLVVLLAFGPAAAALAVQGKTVEHIRVPDPLSELLARGFAALQKKDYEGAVRLFCRYLAAKPGGATTHFELGYAYTALERWPEVQTEYEKAAALEQLSHALRLDPGQNDALRDPVAVQYLSGNYAGALEGLDQLAQREPLAPVSWFVRATCYDKLGRIPQVLDAYQKFLALDHDQQYRDEFWARQRIRILEFELYGEK